MTAAVPAILAQEAALVARYRELTALVRCVGTAQLDAAVAELRQALADALDRLKNRAADAPVMLATFALDVRGVCEDFDAEVYGSVQPEEPKLATADESETVADLLPAFQTHAEASAAPPTHSPSDATQPLSPSDDAGQQHPDPERFLEDPATAEAARTVGDEIEAWREGAFSETRGESPLPPHLLPAAVAAATQPAPANGAAKKARRRR
jgi:hypothetical protein